MLSPIRTCETKPEGLETQWPQLKPRMLTETTAKYWVLSVYVVCFTMSLIFHESRISVSISNTAMETAPGDSGDGPTMVRPYPNSTALNPLPSPR